jgi:chromosome segregation ATPase
MFDDFFYSAPKNAEERVSKLERLAEIQDELERLIDVRKRLMERLARMRSELEGHRRESLDIRMRTMELVNRIRRRLRESPGSSITPEEERMLAELEAWQQRLERDITDLEHRVKVAAFEAESLEMTLNELRQQADEIAAELEEENGFSEKH